MTEKTIDRHTSKYRNWSFKEGIRCKKEKKLPKQALIQLNNKNQLGIGFILLLLPKVELKH